MRGREGDGGEGGREECPKDKFLATSMLASIYLIFMIMIIIYIRST